MRYRCSLGLLVMTLSLCGCFESALETIPPQTGRRIEDMPDGIYRSTTDRRSYYRFGWDEIGREYAVWNATADNPESTEPQQIRTIPIGESKRFGRVYLIQREDERREQRIFRYEIVAFNKRSGNIQVINFDGEPATKRLQTVAKTARIPLEWIDEIWTHVLRTDNHLDQKWFFQLLASKLDEFGDEIMVTEYVRDGSASPIIQQAGTAAKNGAAARNGPTASVGPATATPKLDLSATVTIEHPRDKRPLRLNVPIGWRKTESAEGSYYRQINLRAPDDARVNLSVQYYEYGIPVQLKGGSARLYFKLNEFLKERTAAYAKQSVTGRLTEPIVLKNQSGPWSCFEADVVEVQRFDDQIALDLVNPDNLLTGGTINAQELAKLNNVRHAYGVADLGRALIVVLYTSPIAAFDANVLPAVLESVKGVGSVYVGDRPAIRFNGEASSAIKRSSSVYHDIPQGVHEIEVSLVGYKSVVIPNFSVKVWRTVKVDIEWERKSYSESEPEFQQQLRAKPNDPQVYVFRGWHAMNEKLYDQAIADFTKGLEATKDDPELLRMRAWGYRDKGEYDKAILDINRSMELEGKPSWVLFERRGDVKLRMNDIDGAIADYDRASAIIGGAYFEGRAKARIQKGDVAGALEEVNGLIKRLEYWSYFELRGTIKRQLGDAAGSQADAAKAEELKNRSKRIDEEKKKVPVRITENY